MGGTNPPPTTPRDPPQTPPRCPETIRVVLSGPVEGIVPNSWLDVFVDRSEGSPRVLVRDPTTGNVVGAIAGIPQLSVLVRCIEDGVEYQALVTSVDGGRVDVTVTKQE